MQSVKTNGSINKKKHYHLERRKAWWGRFFIIPWVVGIVFFFIRPMFQAILYAFCKITVTNKGFELSYIGFDNILYFFTKDPYYIRYLSESIFGIIPKVLVIVSFSMLIAVILRSKFAGRTLTRAIFFFPVIIASGIVIVMLKVNVLMSGAGVSNMAPSYLFRAPSMIDLFAQLGIPHAVLDPITSIINQIFDLTWNSGVQILLLLASINNIPLSSYEVADMEGATNWEKFWKITFPMISPTLLVAVVYTFIDSFTDYGNPIMGMIQYYYSKGDFSYSATAGVIYFVFILLLIGIINKLASRKIFYINK